MLQGFLGKKIGMTQIFREDGRVVPVTVVEAGPCVVTQVKTKETDGYEAVQLGFGDVKRRNKPLAGHMKDSRLSRYLREVSTDDTSEFEVGQTIGVDIFEAGEKVDVIGRSKGRGFAGTMKRWNFGGLRATHGVSISHRSHGSTGA
ncbi:MAG TPA: 50S ribosomal protein L3, partial [Dehalococcoidia bacterium]|nr:50S ribosomal protein L3 [Dehalococcoidia bacterium]